MILHIDMDAFFASIEQAINPRLKGKPVVVGTRPNKLYTVVCAASYEAKALGINSGMPTKEAFSICPHLEFVAADQNKYIWTSEKIHEMLKGYGHTVNYVSIDEFQVEVRELELAEKLARKIQEDIRKTFNITASIGIAKNCLLAKLASKLDKPSGITVLTAANLQEILRKTPAEKIAGIGPASQESLAQLGIKTCLELYQKSAASLSSIFGKNGLNLYQALHCEDSLEAEETDEKPKSIGHSYTFPRTTQNTGFIQAWIRLLAEMVGRRLREKNLTATTVHLWLNGPEIGNFSCQKSFSQATNDSDEIYRRSLKIMAQKSKNSPKIRALGVTCSSLSEENYPPLFKEQKRREGLVKSMDKINERFGENTIFPAQITLTRKIH